MAEAAESSILCRSGENLSKIVSDFKSWEGVLIKITGGTEMQEPTVILLREQLETE